MLPAHRLVPREHCTLVTGDQLLNHLKSDA